MEKTKQNKHRGNFTLPRLGLGRQAMEGEMVQGRATEERELKRETEIEGGKKLQY